MATARRNSDRANQVLGRAVAPESVKIEDYVHLLRSVIERSPLRTMRKFKTIPDFLLQLPNYTDNGCCHYRKFDAELVREALHAGVSASAAFLWIGDLVVFDRIDFRNIDPRGRKPTEESRLLLSRKGEIYCERRLWVPDPQPREPGKKKAYILKSIQLELLGDAELIGLVGLESGRGKLRHAICLIYYATRDTIKELQDQLVYASGQLRVMKDLLDRTAPGSSQYM